MHEGRNKINFTDWTCSKMIGGLYVAIVPATRKLTLFGGRQKR